MKSALLAPAFALLLLTPATAQQAGPDFSSDRVRAHVDFLASDLLEGRNAGERGYDIAARYVAGQFRALGLKPAVNGSWYQQVPFQQTAPEEGATLSIGGRSFANGGDVVIAPSLFARAQTVSAPVVFVGFGMDDPKRGFDDYAGLDVKGKVVAILSGFPKGVPSDVGAHLSAEKAIAAQRNGAIGVISIVTPAGLGAFPWERRAPAQEALFAGARRSLKSVLDEASKEGGRPKGFALSQQVRFDQKSSVRTLSSPNVIGMLEGSDPALKDEYVLLMGHLDHDGVDESLEGDKIYNGAMDNAAGIATMLEAARAMAMSPNRPRRSILFAAVTAEEDGLLGAEYLAKHPVVGSGKVVAVVNLDMPILTYDFQDVIAFGAEHSTMGPAVARAVSAYNVKLSPDPAPEEGLFTRSDHYTFVKEGVPSIFLVTGPAGEGEKAGADFLANHYHQVSDEPDLPFNWDAGAKFARINYLIAREIADAPEAPRWYQGSFFGDVFAPQGQKAPQPR